MGLPKTDFCGPANDGVNMDGGDPSDPLMVEPQGEADEDQLKLGIGELGTSEDGAGTGGEFGVAGAAVGALATKKGCQRLLAGDRRSATGALSPARVELAEYSHGGMVLPADPSQEGVTIIQVVTVRHAAHLHLSVPKKFLFVTKICGCNYPHLMTLGKDPRL